MTSISQEMHLLEKSSTQYKLFPSTSCRKQFPSEKFIVRAILVLEGESNPFPVISGVNIQMGRLFYLQNKKYI